MNKYNKGLAPIAIVFLAIAGLAILGIGAYYYVHKDSVSNPPAVVATSTSPITTMPTSTPPIVPVKPPVTTPPASAVFISPTSGPVGTLITIHGSGFAATGNTVTMNGMVGGGSGDLPSNGSVITFNFPSSLGPNCRPDQACPQYLVLVRNGGYQIDVVSPDGTTQEIGTFTVTGAPGPGVQ